MFNMTIIDRYTSVSKRVFFVLFFDGFPSLFFKSISILKVYGFATIIKFND